jgi:hypothetical protein
MRECDIPIIIASERERLLLQEQPLTALQLISALATLLYILQLPVIPDML